jgi:hypothetical protein
MSKEDAERILNAVLKEEKNTQENVKKAKIKGQKTKTEKDW